MEEQTMLIKALSLRLLAIVIVGGVMGVSNAHAQSIEKRAVTVADAIEMTQLGEPAYFLGDAEHTQVAHFSPDGTEFVIVVRKGNLKQNTNEYSLLLFRSIHATRSPRPTVLLTMASSSNREGIKDVQWIEGGRGITFIGEKPGIPPQIYALDVESRRLTKLTRHATPVFKYSASADGKMIVFEADPPSVRAGDNLQTRRSGILVTTQSIETLLSVSGNDADTVGGQLFLQAQGE